MRENGLIPLAGRLGARNTFRRIGVGFLFISFVGALFLSSFDSKHIEGIRSTFLDVTVAVVKTVDHPVQSVRSMIADGARLVDAYGENGHLRRENMKLRGWESEARRVFAENEVLRDILGLSSSDFVPQASARVVGAMLLSPMRTVIIDKGTLEDVAVGDAVVAPGGLVGHVIAVANRAARVLLLTDASSLVAVFGERSGRAAILGGNRSLLLDFAYLENGEVMQSFTEGEFLYTSGGGGMLPANLMVGKVVRDGDRLRVLPSANWSELRFVQTVRRPVTSSENSLP